MSFGRCQADETLHDTGLTVWGIFTPERTFTPARSNCKSRALADIRSAQVSQPDSPEWAKHLPAGNSRTSVGASISLAACKLRPD